LVTFSYHVLPESRAHSGTLAFKAGDARFVIVLVFSLSYLGWVCLSNRADRAMFLFALFISVRQMNTAVDWLLWCFLS